MEHSCTEVLITTTQTPSANGLFYYHYQKSTDSGYRFGLIWGNRVPEMRGGGVVCREAVSKMFRAQCVQLCKAQWVHQPALFFANKTATSLVPGTNTGTNKGSVSSVSSAAKKTKPDQPKKPGEKQHVAKHVTVDQRVEKYGKYGLYNNNNLPMCKCCCKKVDHQREDSIQSHITAPLHDQNCEKKVGFVALHGLRSLPIHTVHWHVSAKQISKSARGNDFLVNTRQKNGTRNGRRSLRRTNTSTKGNMCWGARTEFLKPKCSTCPDLCQLTKH